MINYKVVIADLDDNIIGEFENFTDLKFNHALNRESDCNFKISLSDPKANSAMLQVGRREVFIYRQEDGTATKVWAGIMVNISGSLSEQDDKITVSALGYLSLFKQRVLTADRSFTATDAGLIAWTLIDESQSQTDGNFGITQGTIETSVDRDRNYDKYQNIYDLIVQLSEVENGFDFEITNAKEFNIYYPYRGDDLSENQILEWGKNIKSISFAYDFTDPANEVIVLGAGQGDAMETSTRTDTTLRSDYKLRQKIVSYKNVEGQTFLDAKGDKVLNQSKLVLREYNIVQVSESDPEYTTLQMGDFVRVRISYGGLEIDDVVRIIKITVNYQGGKEIVSYNFQYLS